MPFRSFPPPPSSSTQKLPDLHSSQAAAEAEAAAHTDPHRDDEACNSCSTPHGFFSSLRQQQQRHSDFSSRPSRLARARTLEKSASSSLPLDITNPHHRPSALQHKPCSVSNDLDRDQAWEANKEQNPSFNYDDRNDDDGFQELYGPNEVYDADDDAEDEDEDEDDAFHDCDEEDWETCHQYHAHHAPNPRKSPLIRRPLQRTRTRSLTDEDLDELRGSIELGFGFSHHESSNLKSTLPALELYYAINRQYEDSKGRGSPITPLERTSSAGSNGSISNEAWRISSPGDHPSRVKTRLRHWAQVVACSIKQSF